jgi:putative ABC transport system permease protein
LTAAPLKVRGSLGTQIVGLPTDSDFYHPLIVAGHWLEAADTAERVLVLNADTAKLNAIAVGDTLRVALPGRPDESWRVVGLYRWLVGTGYAVEPLYAPLEALRQASGRFKDQSMVVVKGDGATTLEAEAAFADRIKSALERAGLPLDHYATSLRLADRQHLDRQFRPVIAMLLGVAAMMATVGAVGLSGALSIGVMQRRREIGMLRAIGASSSTIFRWVFLEGLFQAVSSWLLAVPLTWLGAEPASRRLGQIMFGLDLDHIFDWRAAGLWLGIVLVTAGLASIGPARGATRITVRESLTSV